MDGITWPLPDPHSCRRGLRLALLLSLAFHGLFALALWTLTASDAHSRDDTPLAEIPVIVMPGGEPAASPTPEHPPIPSQAADRAPDAEPTPIHVRELPLHSANPATDAASEPRVVASAASGPAKTGQGAGDAAPAFFGVPVQAHSVVFVIDRSTSMGLGGGLDAAKSELLRSLDHLPTTTRIQILFYHNDVKALLAADADGFAAANDATRRQAAERLQSLRAGGGTNHMAALHRALALRPALIVWMTDADDFTIQQMRTITEWNRTPRAVIHTLEWNAAGRGNGALKALAECNRGVHRRLGNHTASGGVHPRRS